MTAGLAQDLGRQIVHVSIVCWRAAHVAGWTDVYRTWAFEDERPMLTDFEVPGTRDGLVQWVLDAQSEFARHVDALTADDLTALRPAHWGEDVLLHRLVAIISYEHTHHGAEIGALRDLHRGHARVQPPPTS